MDVASLTQPQAGELTETGKPRKRPRRTITSDDLPEGATVKQSKACSHCRKLKVKCDASERASGSCSRCTRLSLQCLRELRSWSAADPAMPNADDFQWRTELSITKLERALEDVLEKLSMPALELYVSPAIRELQHPPRPTQPNSPEPVNQDRDVSPDPMNSLIEATQLGGLRSQLRSVKQRRKGGMRRMDHDLIAEQLITLEEAEELLNVFKQWQNQHLFSAGLPASATLDSIRASSTVLFTAVMLVAALIMPGKETFHDMCHSRFSGLVAAVMFDRFHTLDDIRGLCIAAYWEPHLSWKLSGLSIRMATELNLHHAFYEAFNEPEITSEARKECLEKARLWYLLYILDHQSSVTYGRPPVMSDELRPIKDYEILMASEHCEPGDQGLLAEVTGLVTLSRAFKYFGLEPRRTMSGDDASILNHLRFTEKLQVWQDRWRTANHHLTELTQAVELHYNFSNLVLNSLVLRGRPLEKIADMPASLRPLALKAIEAAHAVAQQFLSEPRYKQEIVGMPLYLHSMIAFAVVFLMKMSYRWHLIGITIDPLQRTIPLVEDTIKLLQSCNAGANHMVFSMAKGFERMLRQLRRNAAINVQGPSPGVNSQSQWPALSPTNGINLAQTQSNYAFGQPMFTPTSQMHINHESPNSAFSHGNWGFQDEELWSMGLGYDLLEPGGQMSADFNFQML